MRPFAYVRPDTLDDVLALAESHGPAAMLLAGGTDVVTHLRLGKVHPDVVIDLKRVAALRDDIVQDDGRLVIGARNVMTDLIADARVRRYFPALVEAARVVGSVQIRNRATLVGNVCNASPAADTAPPLLVYGASVNLLSRTGRRRVPMSAFILAPGRTVVHRGELVESIELPVPAIDMAATFGRVTRRRGVDLATINLSCLVTASGMTRFAFGAVGPRPFMVQDDSGMLASRSGSAASREALLHRFLTHAGPIDDVRGTAEYRKAMLAVMSRRALESAIDRLHGMRKGG